jgi:hypothetical protein
VDYALVAAVMLAQEQTAAKDECPQRSEKLDRNTGEAARHCLT